MSNLTDGIRTYKQQLSEWINTIGISQYQPSNDKIEKILSYTKDELRSRSSVELSEDAFMLAQYALFLQQKINECKAFLTWSQQVKNKIFGDDIQQFTIWVRTAEIRMDRVAYLTRRIEMIGQTINNLVRARYNEGRN